MLSGEHPLIVTLSISSHIHLYTSCGEHHTQLYQQWGTDMY